MSEAATCARGPQPLWAAVPPAARARYLRRAAQAVLDEVDGLAELLAVEAGVPRTEALLAELLPSVAGLNELAEAGPGALADRLVGNRALRRSELFHAPVGVVGVRGGDGSPWAEPTLDAAAALLAGNGVVLASRYETLGRRLQGALLRAGLPDELFCVSDDLAGCDRVVESGLVGPQAAMLVLDGAPLDRVVPAALQGAFARGGRGTATVGRVVCLPGVTDFLRRRLEDAVGSLVVGDPRDAATEVAAPARPAVRLAPVDEDLPGPVLELCEAPDESAAIAACAGAAAVSVWTGDHDRGERIARTLDVPVTWIDEHGDAFPAAPVRIARHTRVRQLASKSVRLRYARWLPHDPALVRATETAARVLYGRESERWSAIRRGAVPFARTALRIAREARR